uniref:Uncharacterized protein n=1 Tax=Tetranychus urticae TaxID=32264 RepID=T1JQD5_TETUR
METEPEGKATHLKRRKIETEERDSTKRSSFICCSYCGEIVEEDPDVLPKADSRLILAKFNDQMEPLYMLLKEVEDIKIPADLLEPDPIEVNGSTIKVTTSEGFED